MIKIGTDCSGIEAPIEALQNICKKYKLSYSHEFSSDISEYVFEYINNNHKPKILFNDMTKRNVKDIPNIDIYVSGFPCQPFSRANKFKTPVDPRLNLFEDCLKVISNKLPKFFILENVKTLVTLNNGSYFNDIIKRLENFNEYSIYYKVINSKDMGIPQSRDRLYIIGVLNKDKKNEFSFPNDKEMKNIRDFVDWSNESKNEIKESNKELFQNIPHDSVFIDTGFRTAKFPNTNKWAPCITAQPNMWCVPLKRKASVKEYFWLQGFNPDNKNITLSDHRMKILIGNSMTVNVIEELLTNGLKSIGLL